MNITAEEVFSLIYANKWLIIGPLLLILALIILLIINSKKNRVKQRESIHKELTDYVQMFIPPEPRIYSGSISVGYDDITYSRGNRSVKFDIPVLKVTKLYLSDVNPWFEGRNYNEREAYTILEDIKDYLIKNKFCKTVEISDEEEEEEYPEQYEEDINI